jgi:uncharacterized protein YozE (UPF0346 family)
VTTLPPYPFKRWFVKNYSKDETALGDLARDLQDAADCPATTTNKAELLAYLEARSAPAGALRAFDHAWEDWTQECALTCSRPGCTGRAVHPELCARHRRVPPTGSPCAAPGCTGKTAPAPLSHVCPRHHFAGLIQ